MRKLDEDILRAYFRLEICQMQRLQMQRVWEPESFNWKKEPPPISNTKLIRQEELRLLGFGPDYLRRMKVEETRAKEEMERLVVHHPLWPHFEKIKGFSHYLAGAFVAAGGDIERAPKVSSFWKGMGLDVLPDGSVPRRIRGSKDERRIPALPHVTKIGEQIRIQLLKSGGYAKEMYDDYKKRYVAKYPDRIKLFNHKAALRAVQKKLYACYSHDTEVLTDSGFKGYEDMAPEDKLATMNTETGALEYQLPLGLHQYYHEGNMVGFDTGERISLLVTPDHRMLVRPRSNPEQGWRFIRAEEFVPELVEERRELVVAGEINAPETTVRRWRDGGQAQRHHPSIWEIPRAPLSWVDVEHEDHLYLPYAEGHAIKNVDRIPAQEWLQFLGWWLAEGSTTKAKAAGGYMVSLASQAHREEFAQLIEKMGFHPIIQERGVVISSKQLYEYFVQFGKAADKYIPKDIKVLDEESLGLMFESYGEGDGTKRGDEVIGFSSVSKQLAEDMAEVALKLGYGIRFSEGTTKNHVLTKVALTRTYTTPRLPEPRLVEYEGPVWCATVPNGNILVRRNGRVAFCGNCLWREWRLAYGLPAPDPYVYDVLQHGSQMLRIEDFYKEEAVLTRKPAAKARAKPLTPSSKVT